MLVRDETGRAPTAEAREGTARVSVEREQLLFAVLPTDAHAIRRVEAENARPHVAHSGQHALDVVWRQLSNVILSDDDGVFVCRTGQPGGAKVAHHRGNGFCVGVERDYLRHGSWKQVV